MVAEEAGRDMTWPFLAGGVAVFFMLGMGFPALLPAEGKKGSKYISMIEGRHGKLEGVIKNIPFFSCVRCNHIQHQLYNCFNVYLYSQSIRRSSANKRQRT